MVGLKMTNFERTETKMTKIWHPKIDISRFLLSEIGQICQYFQICTQHGRQNNIKTRKNSMVMNENVHKNNP